MKYVTRLMIVNFIITLFFSIQVNATVISGNHTTVGNKTVNLGGLEWLDFNSTSGMSRISVETELLSGGSLDGWRYASLLEFDALIDSISGGVNGWSWLNADGGNWMSSNFGTLWNHTSGGGDLFYGNDGDCNVSTIISCLGHWRDDNSAGDGWFDDRFGGTGGIDVFRNKADTHSGVASVLVRARSVPEPSAIALMGLGLLGFGVTRRKQKKN